MGRKLRMIRSIVDRRGNPPIRISNSIDVAVFVICDFLDGCAIKMCYCLELPVPDLAERHDIAEEIFAVIVVQLACCQVMLERI